MVVIIVIAMLMIIVWMMILAPEAITTPLRVQEAGFPCIICAHIADGNFHCCIPYQPEQQVRAVLIVMTPYIHTIKGIIAIITTTTATTIIIICITIIITTTIITTIAIITIITATCITTTTTTLK